MQPKTRSILETSLYVADLQRSVHFYKNIFGFKILNADERFCAFNIGEKQVLLLFVKKRSSRPIETLSGTIPSHDGDGHLHLAFEIGKMQYDRWRAHLRKFQISIESEICLPAEGRSIYFRDPDGHLIELGTRALWRFEKKLRKNAAKNFA